MSRRTGSRWGHGDRQHQHGRNNDNNRRRNASVQPPAVSDEDAMKALLFSAESRSREREGNTDDHSKQGRGGGRDGRRTDSYKGMSSRWGDKGNPGRSKGNDEVSYYGPGKNTNNSSSSHVDRKRKRPADGERGRWGDNRNNDRGDNAYHRVEDDDGKAKTNGEKDDDAAKEDKPPPEFKPNFGLSGALAKDTESGNVYKGVLLKFKEPPEARAPNTQWRFYVFKKKAKGSDAAANDDGSDLIETLHVSKQSAYLFGRNTDIADIPLLHPSLSSQHAVLQYRAVPVRSDKIGAPPRLSCQPYVIDLESTNGTFLNGVRIDAARYYQLKRGDVLTFGASTREYVLLTENTTSVN